MKTLKYTRQFKKDLKKIQHNPKRIIALKKVLKILQETGILPKEYKPHFLEGVYKGFMECHVESDLLLIWLDTEANIIKLIRLGAHSELFKKTLLSHQNSHLTEKEGRKGISINALYLSFLR